MDNSQAKYIDIVTSDGRMPLKELIYMSAVYDMYIFLKRFEMTYKNILIYIYIYINVYLELDNFRDKSDT